jgi:hypothetical protein
MAGKPKKATRWFWDLKGVGSNWYFEMSWGYSLGDRISIA